MGAAAALLAVLALSVALELWGLRWGLPNVHSWAPDEVLPAQVLEGMEQRFSGGWWSKYPPLQFYLLAGVYTPLLAGSSDTVSVSDVSATYARLFVAGRLLNVAMGAGVLVVVFLCGRLLSGRVAGLSAALLLALSPTFAFYARFVNLDVPYLFWFALALLAYLHALRSQSLAAWLGFAAAAACAVTTKDQAYGLFVLPGLHLVLSLARSRAAGGERIGLAALRDVRVGSSLAVGALVFAIVHNLAFNFAGFRQHLENITGPSAEGYRMFEPGFAGQAGLAALTLRLVSFVLGGPAVALALGGLLLATFGQPRRALLLATLLPVVSYQLFFQAVVLYSYDRFVLPMAFVLVLFAGSAIAWLVERSRWGRPVAGLALAAAAGFGLLRCVSLDLALRNDGRYAAEAWLHAHVRPGERVAALGPLEYLPRLSGLDWKQRSELERAVLHMDPAYIVVNADYARQAEYPQARELYERLDSGALGYDTVYAARGDLRWPYRIDEVARAHAETTPSNLDKVNPEIRVYRRRAP